MTPTRRRRPHLLARLGVAVLTFAAVVAGAAGLVAVGLRHLEGPERVPVRCAAENEGTQWYLEPDQAETAALLTGTSIQRGLPARAATIALATGLQESRLRNIDYGDRDSVGIFQQRPSQGWGSVEEIMDPVYSTNAFFDVLETIEDYPEMPVTVAAQAVQRSGFPDAYAQHEPRSRAWASALTGHSPAALTCTLTEPEQAGDAAAVVERAARDLDLSATPRGAHEVLLDVSGLGPDERHRWVAAHWAVAVADGLQVVEVVHGEHRWTREGAAWETADEPLSGAQVLVRLAGDPRAG